MSCIKKLTQDIVFDCSSRIAKGIEKKVLFVDFSNIQREYTQFNKEKTTIKRLFIEYGTARMFQGVKNHFTGGQKLANDGFSHEVQVRIYHPNKENFEQINNAIRGTFVAIVETKYKGYNGQSAFEVLGYDAGLKLTQVQRDYAKSSTLLTFATSSVKELRMPYKFFDTDYQHTSFLFNTKFTRKVTPPADPLKIFDYTFDNTFE